MLVVLTTVPNYEEAESIASGLVESRLAGCVQILPQMTSIYLWEGKVQKEPEQLLLIKTIEEKYEETEAFILRNHSYEVPEIVALNAVSVSDGYLKWLTGTITPRP